MEIGTTQIFIAQIRVQTFYLIYVRYDGIGKGHTVPSTIPETLHGIIVTTITHTGSRGNFVRKIILHTSICIGFSIQTNIRHKIKGNHWNHISIAVHQHFLQAIITHRHCCLKAGFCGISIFRIVKRQRVLFQETVRTTGCQQGGRKQRHASFGKIFIFHNSFSFFKD